MRVKGVLFCVTAVILLAPSFVSARSGCCSSHGGVCGCGCCDGSSLSRTCAPYYPQCNRVQEEAPAQVQQVFVPVINTPVPLPTKIIYPTSSPTLTPSPKPTLVKLQKPTIKPSQPISPTILVPVEVSKAESDIGIWAWLRRIFKY